MIFIAGSTMFKTVLDLLAHKRLSWDEGSITLFGQFGIMLHVSALVEIQKLLEKKGSENTLYYGGKASGKAWVKSMLDSYKMNTIEEQITWGEKVITLAGNGKMKVIRWNVKDAIMVYRLHDSTFSKAYGKSDRPVDNLCRGMFAGASCVFFGRDVDAVEVACISQGDEYCEFIVMPRENFGLKDKESKRQLKRIM